MRSNKGIETSLPLNAYAMKSSRLIDEGRKVRSLLPIAAAFVIFGCATTSAQSAVPSNIVNAVADQNRPDEDRQRDADRKPAEVLTFVGIKNGEKVADFIPGTGYFSRILSSAVGPQGHVYGFFPSELANFVKRPLPPSGSTPYLEFKNVSVIAVPVNDEGESDLLHNAGDPRTANVKDPTIRGKTDQFILEFRKPK
jgi:predicted methyltransferase